MIDELHQRGVRHLLAADMPEFVREVLLNPKRRFPVVAFTTDARLGASRIDASHVAAALSGKASVVQFETGEASWALTRELPDRLDVYGGAARIWWPGLRVDSEPLDHPLLFVRSDAEAAKVEKKILSAVRSRGDAPSSEPTTATEASSPPPLDPVKAVVVGTDGGQIDIEVRGLPGTIVEADLPIDVLASCAEPGLKMTVQPLRVPGSGGRHYSLAGLLPDGWELMAREVQAGQLIPGRVQNLHTQKGLVFVDVLPGVTGVCHKSELHYDFVENMGEYVEVGEVAAFRIVELDPERMQLKLSRKKGFGEQPRDLPSLIPGGRPFVWTADTPQFENLRRRKRGSEADGSVRVLDTDPTKPDAETRDKLDGLTEELSEMLADRKRLLGEVASLNEKLSESRKQVRSAEDRFEALQRRVEPELDPLSSERAFLLAVRLCYARMCDEGDRHKYPLQRMRVGSSFLESVRNLDGIELEKIVEVCTLVACDRAHESAGRAVHPLRDGLGGAGARTRSADGAKAWRCSLQTSTPSARRLHWWKVSDQGEAVIEFASTGLHDDFGIPE